MTIPRDPRQQNRTRRALDLLSQASLPSASTQTSVTMTEPADSPASVDALRDDLNDNALAELKAAIESLAQTVNDLIDGLTSAGLGRQ